ncbi:hypothetical protein Hanom_Chr08g00751861 [Helianthus anomalus]
MWVAGGDRWVSGFERCGVSEWFEFKIQTFEMAAMTWRGERMGGSQLGLSRPPTPGLKAKPQGPHPNPSPPRVVAWAFSPNPRPIPHGLRDPP